MKKLKVRKALAKFENIIGAIFLVAVLGFVICFPFAIYAGFHDPNVQRSSLWVNTILYLFLVGVVVESIIKAWANS